MLNFMPPATTAGPLDVLELLSDEAKALYTSHLLNLARYIRAVDHASRHSGHLPAYVL